jgi:hypothetical protein
MNSITYNNKNDNMYSDGKKVSEEVRAVAVEVTPPIISCCQVNRAGFGSTDIDMDNMSESIGPAMSADLIIASTQGDELRNLLKFAWTIIKNRYGINKKRILVDVNYYRMRVYEADETQTKVENSTKTELPATKKEIEQKVSNAVDDVIGIITKNDKVKKNIIFE